MFVEMNGQTSNQLIREGNRLFSSKKYAQSEILYRKAVDKDVNNAIANYNLGRSLQEQKKNAEAKKFYELQQVREGILFVSQVVTIT